MVPLLIVMILFSTFLLLPIGNCEKQINSDREYWQDLAEKAWQFYQPDRAVNSHTGLHGAAVDWPYFTEWDLGTYIQAIIDARELGLIQNDGQWGFNSRIEKILHFLQTRQLTSNNVPYNTYNSVSGEPHGDSPTFCIDEGKLYLSLYNLKIVQPDLTQTIDNIVKVRHNNTEIVPDPLLWVGNTDMYTYYASIAFKSFGFSGWENMSSQIINCIVSQENVTTYGIQLPKAHICNEPLLLSFFETNSSSDANFFSLLSRINSAQEQRYAATGKYTAFAEGNTNLGDPTYVYEYVVDADGSTWKVKPEITPIAYLKVAVAFYAICGTEYNKYLVEHIRNALSSASGGFQDGVAEDGRSVSNVVDRTNGLILAAAKYAISHLPSPSPSPSSTQTASPSIFVTPSPSSSESFSPSRTPNASISDSPSSLSPSASPTASSSLTPTLSASTESSGWFNETTILLVIAIVACMMVVLPTFFFLKRKGSKKKT